MNSQVDDLLVLEEQLDVDVRSLDTCQYAHSTFSEILNKIQKAVDDLSLHQYSNLHIWVQRLDEQVRHTCCISLLNQTTYTERACF